MGVPSEAAPGDYLISIEFNLGPLGVVTGLKPLIVG